MSTMDFEKRVEPAVRVTSQLARQMLDDLDPVGGGFGWWRGHMDDRRIALLSEYVLASVNGASQAIVDASLAADTYAERRSADNFWLQSRWSTVARTNPHATDDDFLAAAERGLHERRRAREIGLAAEHCFYHLAQAMDRLAACVIGVGALHVDIVRADWRHIEQAIAEVRTGGKRLLDDHASPGRSAQEDFLRVVDAAVSSGPADWLQWMLDLRNVNAHRAPKMTWQLMTGSGRTGNKLAVPFYLQPGWPEVEAMAHRPRSSKDPSDLLLMRDPLDTMIGFVEQVTKVVADTADSLLTLWSQRRTNPMLLVQPGTQWKKIMARRQLTFEGFSTKTLTARGKNVYLHPDSGKRLLASKVLDADAGFWGDD